MKNYEIFTSQIVLKI